MAAIIITQPQMMKLPSSWPVPAPSSQILFHGSQILKMDKTKARTSAGVTIRNCAKQEKPGVPVTVG